MNLNPVADPSELAESEASWWRRKCGGRHVVTLALPLMISTLSYSLLQFCDRIFLAWWSSTALAAVMPAGVMAWTLMSFPFGVALYTNVFVAQYFGAKTEKRIAGVMGHGLILASLFVPLFILAACFPHFLFRWAGHQSEIAAAEATYFRYMSIGSIAQVYGGVLTSFFIGQGRTRIVMWVDVSIAGINILLDWLLIFGITIGTSVLIEPMGIRGAAIATSVALWLKAFIFLGLMLKRASRQRFGFTKRLRFRSELLSRMFRFGSANGFQFLLECLAIAVFTMMIAKLGEVPAAATTVAISVNMMVFVPIWGLSTAVSTLVGQEIGDGYPSLAARATWTSMTIGLVYTGLFAVLYLAVPGIFVLGHQAGAEDFEAISELSRWLLIFVAAYCLFDTIQIVFVGAIKGAGDTTFVVITSLACSGLFVAAGFLGYQFVSSQRALLFWWWATLTGWIFLLSIIFSLRFVQGKWRTMSVIEQGLIEHHDG